MKIHTFGGKYDRFYSRSPVAKLLWLPVLLLALWPSTLVQLVFQEWKQLQVNIGEGMSGKIPQLVHLKGKQYEDGAHSELLIKEIMHELPVLYIFLPYLMSVTLCG